MALVEFNGSSTSRSNITLRAGGSIFISNAIINKLEKDAVAVFLYIDDEKTKFGMKLSKEYDENKKNCKKITVEKSGVSFSIMSVLRHYNISLKNAYKNMEMEIQNEIIIIDLEKVASKNSESSF